MILVGLEIGSLEDAGYPSDETFQYLLGFSAIFLCYAIIKVPSTGEMRFIPLFWDALGKGFVIFGVLVVPGIVVVALYSCYTNSLIAALYSYCKNM